MNADSTKTPSSLRGRLLALLIAFIAASLATQAVVAYRVTLQEADEIFDYQMRQMGEMLLRSGPAADLLPAIASNADQEDLDVLIETRNRDGLLIASSMPQVRLPDRMLDGFSNVLVQGQIYRVYAAHRPSLAIRVAQERDSRKEIARALALRGLWPTLALAVALMVAVAWIIWFTFLPIARLRVALAERRPEDLQPLCARGLPSEILPLVRETNALMARMRAAFEQQRQFVADAAHELRTPLTALQLQSEAIRRADSPSELANAVERQRDGLRRAQRLVTQLLALARQQASATLGHQGRCDLVELARAAVHTFEETTRAKAITLRLTVPDAAWITGPCELARQLVDNLVDNAIKYTPAHGGVHIAIAANDREWLLSVEDSGPGIAAAERERVFDRFYRSANATAEGSGLGLAIVKAAAAALNATVRLRESALGGLRVEVRLGPSDALSAHKL